jgi:hypothetical protein
MLINECSIAGGLIVLSLAVAFVNLIRSIPGEMASGGFRQNETSGPRSQENTHLGTVTEKSSPISSVVDDWYSESINFKFQTNDTVHQGLVSYGVLQDCFAPIERSDGAMIAFLQNSKRIFEVAAAKAARSASEPIELDFPDF